RRMFPQQSREFGVRLRASTAQPAYGNPPTGGQTITQAIAISRMGVRNSSHEIRITCLNVMCHVREVVGDLAEHSEGHKLAQINVCADAIEHGEQLEDSTKQNSRVESNAV